MEDPSPNPTALERIARATGGLYADLADRQAVADMLTRIPDELQVTTETRSARFWNHPALFVLFIALLTGEWIVRRRHHLV